MQMKSPSAPYRERYIKLLCAFTELVGLQPAGCFAIRSCRCGDVHPLVGIVIGNSAEDRLIPLGGIGGEVVGVGYGWFKRQVVNLTSNIFAISI
jgi:hypothetical protein